MLYRTLAMTIATLTLGAPIAHADDLRLNYTSDGGPTISVDRFRPGWGSLTAAEVTVDGVTDVYTSCDEPLFADLIGTGDTDLEAGATIEVVYTYTPGACSPRGDANLDGAVDLNNDLPIVLAGGGGSIPIVGEFERILGAPVLLMGFSLPGANLHAPNEWFPEENIELGIRALAYIYEELGQTRT